MTKHTRRYLTSLAIAKGYTTVAQLAHLLRQHHRLMRVGR